MLKDLNKSCNLTFNLNNDVCSILHPILEDFKALWFLKHAECPASPASFQPNPINLGIVISRENQEEKS